MPSTRRLAHRWSALPRLLERASWRVALVAGVVVALLGGYIVSHPLTSIVVLAVYVGLSAIVTGLAELSSPHRTPRWWTRAFALAWIAGGVAAIAFLGNSLELLPVVLTVLLVVGGIASLGDAVAGGNVSQRVLAATWASRRSRWRSSRAVGPTSRC